MGQWLAEKAAAAGALRAASPGVGRPVCLISGGETTVTVKGQGLGGRNMELALAFALAVDGREGVMLLLAGTDGTDGPTDAAGAIVDGHTAGAGASGRHRPAGVPRPQRFIQLLPENRRPPRYRSHRHERHGPPDAAHSVKIEVLHVVARTAHLPLLQVDYP